MTQVQKDFDKLNPYLAGFLEAFFFTDCNESNPECEELGYADMTEEHVQEIEQLVLYWTRHPPIAALLEAAYEYNAENGDGTYSSRRAGNDLWYCSQGHGTGFWDRGLDNLGQKLSEYARDFGEFHPYNAEGVLVMDGIDYQLKKKGLRK